MAPLFQIPRRNFMTNKSKPQKNMDQIKVIWNQILWLKNVFNQPDYKKNNIKMSGKVTLFFYSDEVALF